MNGAGDVGRPKAERSSCFLLSVTNLGENDDERLPLLQLRSLYALLGSCDAGLGEDESAPSCSESSDEDKARRTELVSPVRTAKSCSESSRSCLESSRSCPESSWSCSERSMSMSLSREILVEGRDD